MPKLEDLTEDQMQEMLDEIMRPSTRERWRAFRSVYRGLMKHKCIYKENSLAAEFRTMTALTKFKCWFDQMRWLDDQHDGLRDPIWMRLQFFKKLGPGGRGHIHRSIRR